MTTPQRLSISKLILRTVFACLACPFVAMYRLQAKLTSAESSFPGWSQALSLLPGKCGVYFRHAFYRSALQRCDEDACVSFGTVISDPGAALGRTVYIGNFCSIGNVTIEDDVLIASHVSVMNGCRQHGTARLDVPMREQQGVYESVTIGRDSWIGEHATVAADVGKHCIIGAGALVLSPVPDYSIAVGVPARVIRDRREADGVLSKCNT